MNRTHKNRAHCQYGGALVEGLLICGVLVSFMVGIPMMGSLVDLKQNTIQASRYAAWEKTVQYNSMPVEDQIDARFFADESAPIRTTEPGAEYLGTNLLWGELRTQQAPGAAPGSNGGNGDGPVSRDNLQLYQRARVTANTSNVHVYLGEGGVPGGAGNPTTDTTGPADGAMYDSVSKAVSEIGQFISKDGWDEYNPNNPNDNDMYINGLLRSHVEVKVENNQIMNVAGENCSQGGAGCVYESTSILVDGWSAADPDQVRDRVHGFVPTNRLEAVGRLVSAVKVVPMLKDLGNLKGAFGCTKLGVRPSKDLHALPTYTPVEGDDC